jgi:hypothetical protein
VLLNVIFLGIVARHLLEIWLKGVSRSKGEGVVAGSESSNAAERERGKNLTAEHGISSACVGGD